MTSKEEDLTLDPSDWESFRKIGYDMIDLLVSYHSSIRDRPVWQNIPQEIKQQFQADIPRSGSSLEEVYEDFQNHILPYPTGNIHPRFWGWVHGTGSSSGALAELLAAMMNPNTGGREHIANYVERQVISWACEMLDFDRNASGLLTSGCSMANLTGLAVARQVQSPVDVRTSGLQSIEEKLLVYGSNQMHSSIQKALEVLGLGSESLRMIEVDDDYKIDIDALRSRIADDLEAGHRPIAIVGNAGTVNSGAIDPFDELADIAEEFNLWFHIDGAFGALARLVDEYKGKMQGFNRADSIAFDMHKWMYMPYEIGCILVRDDQAHRSTFSLRPDYLQQQSRGLASFNKWPTEYGVELSRGFRALKAWMLIKEHGIDTYSKVITKNIRQARYYASLIEEDERIELMAPVELNIVCFRYFDPTLDEEVIESINRELLLRIQESGIAVFSSTQLDDTYCLRIAITNQRSRFEDFDLLYDTVITFGQEVRDEIVNT